MSVATCDACTPDDAAEEVLLEQFSFSSDVAFVPRGDLLEGVTVAPLTAPFEEGCVDSGGDLPIRARRSTPAASRDRPPDPRHPGGSGEVRGADGVLEPIAAGEAVFLHEGEEHEMKSDAGLTALIIEGESLDCFRRAT